MPILKSDRSKFYKLWFRRNYGYKNQRSPFGVNWQPQTKQAPQTCETLVFCVCFVLFLSTQIKDDFRQPNMILDYCLSLFVCLVGWFWFCFVLFCLFLCFTNLYVIKDNALT